MPYIATQIWANIGSGNGLVPDGAKPLPESMMASDQLDNEQQSSVKF